jgi:hypothetical protein
MRKRAAQSPACFEVGDKALVFYGNDEYGTDVVVTDGYDLYCVMDKEGRFVSAKSGERVKYQFGYGVKEVHRDRSYFVAPYELMREDCKPSHLLLVAGAARSSGSGVSSVYHAPRSDATGLAPGQAISPSTTPQGESRMDPHLGNAS